MQSQRVPFTFNSKLLRYIERHITSADFNSHQITIYAICQKIECTLGIPKTGNFNALFISISNDQELANKFWKEKTEELIKYLTALLQANQIEQAILYHIVAALKEFLNSIDLGLPGRYEKSGMLGVTWVSPIPEFKKLNAQLEQLSAQIKPAPHQSQTSTAAILLSILHTVKTGLSYIKNHPIAAYTLLIYSQNILVEATKSYEKGRIAYFPFNGNALDATGNGHDGTGYGVKLTQDRFGRENQAYYFSGNPSDPVGTGAHIRGSAKGFPKDDDDRTIAFWFRPYVHHVSEGVDREGGFFGYGGDSTAGTSFLMLLNNPARPPNIYDIQAHSRIDEIVYEDKTMYGSPNPWAHLAFTSSYSKGTKIYLNGVLANQSSHRISNTVVKNAEFAIGSIPMPNGKDFYFPFNGDMDELAVYDHALSEEAVKELYEAENQKPGWWEEEKNEKWIFRGEGAILATLATMGFFAARLSGLYCINRCRRQPAANDGSNNPQLQVVVQNSNSSQSTSPQNPSDPNASHASNLSQSPSSSSSNIPGNGKDETDPLVQQKILEDDLNNQDQSRSNGMHNGKK